MTQTNGPPNRRQRRIAAHLARKRTASTQADKLYEVWDMDEARAKRIQRQQDSERKAKERFVKRTRNRTLSQPDDESAIHTRIRGIGTLAVMIFRKVREASTLILLLTAVAVAVWIIHLALWRSSSAITRTLTAIPMFFSNLRFSKGRIPRKLRYANTSDVLIDSRLGLPNYRMGIGMGDTKFLVGM